MLIRLATPQDSKQLWALAEDYLAGQKKLGVPDQRKVLSLTIAYGLKHGEAIVVAEDDGCLCGFLAWTGMPDAAEGEVLGMGTYVAPAFRRLGISRQMRDFAKDYCRAKGYSFVSGAVRGDNRAGIESAKRSGAKVIGYLLEWPL